jgi:hypothetical protein
MRPTRADPLEHARIVVDGCLKRDYCRANGIDSATQFAHMREGFAFYRARFGCGSAEPAPPIPSVDDDSASRLSIIACCAFLMSLLLSCFAVCSWYVSSH